MSGPVAQPTPGGSALGERYDLALLRADIFGTWTDDAVVGALLEHMAAPANHPRADENWREQRRWNAREVIGRGMVEIGVREQLLLLPHGLVDGYGDRVQRGVAHGVGQLLGPLLDHFVARVAFLVDRMAEAHDLFLAFEHAQQAF